MTKISAPRDSVSGNATGRRQLKPVTANSPDVATGQASGKRQQKPVHLTADTFSSGKKGIVSPRDHASGLPTGQRMHKPF